MVCEKTPTFRIFDVLAAGDPGMTRTCDLRFRKPSLYPAELRDRRPANRSACSETPYQSIRVIASLWTALFELATLGVDNKPGRCAITHNRDFVNYPAACLFKACADGFSRTFFFRQSSCRGKVD
jgi:hypothetical protein